MVRNYVRKSARATNYTKDELEAAVDAIQRGHLTQSQAATHFNIPRATLCVHLKGKRGKKSLTQGRPPIIPQEIEEELASGLKVMEKWGFGLSRKEVLEVVGDFVKMNGLVTPFKNGIPGEDWFLKFKNRFKLSIKKPQSVEYARKKMTDPFIVQEYFQLLKDTLTHLQLEDKPDQIWNFDETSFSMDPSKTKVVGSKGFPSSRTISGSGKENTTILSGCSASGKKAPPLIVFKGKNIWDKWMAREGKGFPNTSYAASPNGWMETEIFTNYFEKSFLPTIGDARPVLIIFDGHSTHVGAKLITIAMKANVTILKLPPHTSHLLQPLDLCVFKSLKTTWDQKLVNWQRSHVGQRLPKSMFAELAGKTWMKISPDVLKKGFVKAGIHPFNSTVIPESKFDPSALQRWKDSQVLLIPMAQTPLNTGAQVGPVPLAHVEPIPFAHVEPIPLAHVEPIPLAQDEAVPLAQDEAIPLAQVDSIPIDNISVAQTEHGVRSKKNSLPAAESTRTPDPVSFETLLLNTVKQSPQLKPGKKMRVAPGAEVITCEGFLAKLLEPPAVPPKKPRKELNVSPPENMLGKEKKMKGRVARPKAEATGANSKPTNRRRATRTPPPKLPPVPQEQSALGEGKWVLVKYSSKRNILHHYAGIILSKNHAPGKGDWNVSFVKNEGTSFSWPQLEDLDTICEQDVVRILLSPTVDRRGSLLTFAEDLGEFNMA